MRGEAGNTERRTIRTERLTLRPWRESDAERVHAYASEWALARMTSRIPHPYTREMAESFIRGEGARPGQLSWAVETNAEAGLIGAAAVFPAHWSEGAHELGYWIGAPHRGEGYALEMAAALVDAIFDGGHSDKAVAKVMVDNPASLGLLARLGFADAGPATGGCLARAPDDPTAQFPMRAFRLTRDAWADIAPRSWRRFRVETNRLVITPCWPSDADDLAALGNERDVAWMVATLRHPFDSAQARARIRLGAYAGRPGFRAAIRRRADGALVGEIGLSETKPDGQSASSLSYWLGRAHWGRGYAGEAAAAFADWAVARFGLRALAAECYVDNPGSLRVLHKLGFEPVGDEINTCSLIRPEPAPIRVFEKRY